MDSFELLQILLEIYTATVVANILLSLIQMISSKDRAHTFSILYWITIIFISLVNGFFEVPNLKLVIGASLFTGLSQLVLGLFLARIKKVKVVCWPLFLGYFVSIFAAIALEKLGHGFLVYSFPPLIAAVIPFPYFMYWVVKKSETKFTTVQKLFILCASMMSLHYLDWAYFRIHFELFIFGFILAFSFFHIISILIPMAANESIWFDKNSQLEVEVRKRADQLSKANESLFISNKMASLGQLAGGIAHEVNNPLAMISLQADILVKLAEKNRVDVATVEKTGIKIREIVKRISKIIIALRTVSRDEKTVGRVAVCLKDLAFDTLTFCEQKFKHLGIELITKFEGEKVVVKCNPVEISHVLINLINNAIDAVQDLSIKKIEIYFRSRDEFVEVHVRDSGVIDPMIVDKIMDPFFTTKPVDKGTGLGLSISKSIVENHGGKLFLNHQSHTTEFVVSLPVCTDGGADVIC